MFSGISASQDTTPLAEEIVAVSLDASQKPAYHRNVPSSGVNALGWAIEADLGVGAEGIRTLDAISKLRVRPERAD